MSKITLNGEVLRSGWTEEQGHITRDEPVDGEGWSRREVREVYWIFESMEASAEPGKRKYLSRETRLPLRSSFRYPAHTFWTTTERLALRSYSAEEAQSIAESFGGSNDWFMYIRVHRVEKVAEFRERTAVERFGVPVAEGKRGSR